MYEAEVNSRVEPPESLPGRVLARFAEYRERVEARSLLPWGEHCTECVWPSCYTTCELYDRRTDGACRQFVDGVVRIPYTKATTSYLQKITFRQWAKLWTVGTVQCHPMTAADRAERLNILIGSGAQVLPLPTGTKEKVLRKIAYIRKGRLTGKAGSGQAPDYLVLEVYNPNARNLDLTLSIREIGRKPGRIYQRLVSVAPDFTREKIPFAEIGKAVDLSGAFDLELVPNDAENLTLYFGLLDFVKERAPEAPPKADAGKPAKCKCVVWDLDNTLWDGVLVEDGPEGIRIRPEVVDVIQELDRRGILQSVASKNNRDEATAVLERFGLAEYFLHPQIHWQPKSSSIDAVAKGLNIGRDTLVFVDDQPFEREEVSSVWPDVRVLDARDAQSIPGRPEFQVTVTEESRSRRQMYRIEEQRAASEQAHQGDYVGFLRGSRIKVEWAALNDSNLQRVYELAQRTNQMNFSGNRYSMDELKRIMLDDSLETYVLRCSDRFGTYGIVGFALVDVAEMRLMDLMFSCRVQSKRVEHGFLAWLLKRHMRRGGRFHANLRKTSKNAPGSAVFPEMGFVELGTNEAGVTTLARGLGGHVPDDEIIEFVAEESQSASYA